MAGGGRVDKQGAGAVRRGGAPGWLGGSAPAHNGSPDARPAADERRDAKSGAGPRGRVRQTPAPRSSTRRRRREGFPLRSPAAADRPRSRTSLIGTPELRAETAVPLHKLESGHTSAGPGSFHPRQSLGSSGLRCNRGCGEKGVESPTGRSGS